MKAIIIALIMGSVAISTISYGCSEHQHGKKVVKKPVIEQPNK